MGTQTGNGISEVKSSQNWCRGACTDATAAAACRPTRYGTPRLVASRFCIIIGIYRFDKKSSINHPKRMLQSGTHFQLRSLVESPFSSVLSGVTARCADDACTRGRERGEALRVVHRWLQLTLVSFGGVRDACHAVLRGGVAGSAFLKMPLFLVRLELQNGPRRRWRWTASGRGSQRAKEAFHNHQIHRYCPLLLLKFKRSIARRHCVLEPH